MAIIENHIRDNYQGRWDDLRDKWVEPPRFIGDIPTSTVIDRNVITILFASAGEINDLNNWISSSKIVESYFSTEKITADYNGLTVMISMVQSAIDIDLISDSTGGQVKSLLEAARDAVVNPNA